MSTTVRRAFLGLQLLLCACASRQQGIDPAAAFAPPVRDSGFTVRNLGSGVYAVTRNEPLGFINESNSLFIVGDRDVIVVDAQSSPDRTRETIAALRAITTKPVMTLINTHWHDDHVVGNAVYRDSFPGLTIIGHASNEEDMGTMGVQFRKGTATSRAGTIGLLEGFVHKRESFLGGPIDAEESRSHTLSAWLLKDYSVSAEFLPPTPTRTVSDSLILMQGRRRIEILFLGKAHTRGDLVVRLPREGIVASGDLLMNPVQFVGSTSYPREMVATIERLRALAPRLLVPGHGRILGTAESERYATLVAATLRSILQQTDAAVARGQTLEQLRKAIDLSTYRTAIAGASRLNAGLFNYYVAGSAVARAYNLATSPR